MILPKTLRSPFSLGIAILVVLGAFLWFKQQSNVNVLSRRISKLEQQINELPRKTPQLTQLTLKKDLATLEKDRITLENGIYTTLIQSLGGAAFFFTAYFTWRNIKTAEANLKATEDKQITERFSKAIEHLGSDKLEVRLGGIYSLERIAKDSAKDYWQVIEILTAFVREKAHLKRDHEPYNITSLYIQQIERQEAQEEEELGIEYEEIRTLKKDYIYPISVEIQAVLTTLSRRSRIYENAEQHILDLSRTDLRGAMLSGNLEGINLEGADLRYANLKDVNLSHSNLAQANLELIKAERANLQKANLKNAHVHWGKFVDTNFRETNLEEANLCETKIQGSDLTQANLKYTNLTKTELVKSTLRQANLELSILDDANLNQINLQNASLELSSLDRVSIQINNLEGANLEDASLRRVNLENVNLRRANLKDADLTDAKLNQANFEQANLSNTRLMKVNLSAVLNLTPEQVKSAKYWEKASYSVEFRQKLGLPPIATVEEEPKT